MFREDDDMARALWVGRLAQLLIVALPIAVGVLIAVRAVDVPYLDEWEWADLVYKMHLGTLHFADLWVQHGEHRMLFPNLIMLGLARLGGWDPVREQFVSLGVLVLSQVAIVIMIRRAVQRPILSAVAGAVASVFLYGLWQSENFGWGFQTAWFLCNAAAIVVALLLARPNRQPIHVVLAVCVAAIGSYSSSQGLVVWVAGAVAIVLTFKSLAWTLTVWIAMAIATYVGYRHGMQTFDAGHFNVLEHPRAAARYVLTYLGSPLARWLGANGSTVAGILVLGALAAALAGDLRSLHRVRRLLYAAPWYSIAVYAVLCAVVTAAGRAGFGLDQALSSRYTTVASLAWVSVIGLIAVRVARHPLRLAGRRLAAVVVVATVLVSAIVANNLYGWSEWKRDSASLATARSELAGSDPAALPALYPVHARVVMLIEELRAVHDGIFAGP